jgi:von Willebrand factor type A domain
MKTVINRFVIFSVALLGLAGCLRVIEVPVLGDASGAIIKIGTPSKSGQSQIFTLDVHVVDASGSYVRALSKNNFAMKDTITNPSGMKFTLIDVKGGNKTDFKGDYSAFLLLDQSGSTDDTDPNDLRIKAGQIFLDAIGKNDKVALASFTSGTYLYPFTTGYTRLHGGFTNNVKTFYPALDSLQNIIIKGGTPLYTSTEWSINYTAANAPTPNKAVVLFTDGINGGGSSKENTEALSRLKNVPIYTVGLSEGVNFDILNSMALNTGGSFMWAKDAKQLISYFGTLGNLLRGNAEYYTLTFQANANSFPSTGRVLYLQVTLPNGKKFLMPFVVRFG